mgnify:CR=1 FL=1
MVDQFDGVAGVVFVNNGNCGVGGVHCMASVTSIRAGTIFC